MTIDELLVAIESEGRSESCYPVNAEWAKRLARIVRAADEMAKDTQALLTDLCVAKVKAGTMAMYVEDSLDNYRKVRGNSTREGDGE